MGNNQKNSDLVYPVTKETLHEYAKSIFTPIRRGECVTTVWVPMAGRRKHNKFIIENTFLFESELPNYQNYILVYIEPLDLTENSLTGYLKLMAKSFIDAYNLHPDSKTQIVEEREIFNSETVDYSTLLDKLRSLLLKYTNSGKEVIFFVGEFDELEFATKIFFNNLKSLWSRLYPRLHYVFLVREMITSSENISAWGELSEAILQNVIYVPMLNDNDTNYMLDRLSKEYSVDINSTKREMVKKLCGGHPYMLKVAVKVISQLTSEVNLEEHLSEYYELKSVAKGILNLISDRGIGILKKIVLDENANNVDKQTLTFLQKMGYIVCKNNSSVSIFSELFEKEILGGTKEVMNSSKKTSEFLEFDPDKGIIYNGKEIEEKFTRQEYLLLTMFLQNKGKTTSRDTIGGILWGKDSYEKYSDWAIDQIVSKLRKKIKVLGSETKLVTVRGKGYKCI
jgi:DNA-binding winged helix-turn-helix (wHTH) protein